MAYQQEVINNYDREYNGPNNYTGGGWAPDEPITSDKMNNIEAGIVEAIKLSNKNTSDITDMNSRVIQAETNASTAKSQAQTAYNNLNTQLDNIANGSNAWNAIKVFLNATSNSGSAINEGMAARRDLISAMSAMLTEAAGTYTVNNLPSLPARLEAMTTSLNNATSSLQGLQAEINNAKQTPDGVDAAGYHLVDNINVIKNAIAALKGEIEGAHRQVGDTLLQRFTDLNTRLDSIDDANPAEGTTLASRLAAVESELGQLDNSYIDQIMAELDAAHRKNITGLDSLNRRFEEIESAVSTNTSDIGGLDTKVAAIETELNGARIQIGEDEDTHEPIMSTLDQRLDGIDTSLESVIGENGSISTLETQMESLIGQNGSVPDLTTRVSALETEVDMTSAQSRIDLIGGEVAAAHRTLPNGEQDTLKKRFDAMDVRMTNIENGNIGEATSTVVVNNATFNENDIPVLPNDEVPDPNIDYLIRKDDKYYYWKYINNNWELISGGGSGTGTSSALILETLPQAADADINVDYYIGSNENGYLHYRFVDINDTLTPVLIGVNPDNIKTYNIDVATETITTENGDAEVGFIYWYEFDYGEDNSATDSKIPVKIRLPALGGGGGGGSVTQKIQRITPRNITHALNSADKVELQFFYTSGNKGDGAKYTLVSGSTTIASEVSINSGDPEDASSTWPTKEVEVDGTTTVVPMNQTEVPMGFYSIDITDYCDVVTSGKTFRLTIVDTDDPTLSKTMAWEVVVINLAASTTLEATSINNVGSSLSVPYTITGNVEKTVYFYLDDVKIGQITLRASQSNTGPFTIPAQAAGAHRLDIFAQASVNGQTLTSNHAIRDIIWYDSTSNDIVIASPYRYRTASDVVSLQQYQLLEIPYTVIGGVNNTYVVEYFVDDLSSPVDRVTLTNANTGTWSYRANLQEEHTLYIKSNDTVIEIHINVEELKDVDISQVTDNLVIDFNPAGITNYSNRRNWTNGTYSLIVSDNFDWFNGGYGSDLSGDYFLVKAGTRAKFNYRMFTSYISSADGVTTTNSTVFRDGAEMKIAFKTSAVRDADAVWFTNMGKTSNSSAAKSVGIQLNAHNGWLKTDAAKDDSTKTFLYFPYSEEDRIELDININPQTAKNAVYAMSYEDGCPSRAYPYKASEALYHVPGEEAEIVIGSDDCDVYIYRFRIYNAALTTAQVLRNFIADGKDVTESIDRYNRNCIYYDTQKGTYTPYEGPDIVLDPERLALKIPDVKILMLDTPKFTTSKKDFIPNSSLRCIHADGGKIYPSRGKLDNWLFQDGYHSGQGTTSDKYGDAGRNLDFLFMCDGVHNPSDKVSVKKENFLPGYQSSVIFGYGMKDLQGNSLAEEPKYCIDWKDEDTWKPNTPYSLEYTMYSGATHDMLVRYGGQVYKCIEAHTSTEEFDPSKWELQEGYTSKISLTSTSVPNNFFNLKVNIASSENVNNALFQKRYNDFLTYVSPAKMRDSRIKNDMEFVPAIIFVRENDNEFTEETINGETIRTYINHKEFNDTNWHFYALGNIGDSKKTDYTRAYDPEDMNEFTLEISDNNTNNSQFQSGVYLAPYYQVAASPTIENMDSYYEPMLNAETQEPISLYEIDENTHEYRGRFKKSTDEEIVENKTYYVINRYVRTLEPYTLEQDMDEGEIVEGSFTAMSQENDIGLQTTDYLFPIDRETEWEALDENDNPKNMRYWSLMNEGFDGDHSFEMRYACKGDYRDGKVVNDTTGKAKAQLKLNENVWREFYTWLITSDDATFVSEMDQWCVRSSMAFFYAFTHYYTMIDNRAKNTFWHFAKTGKHRIVTHPRKKMLHTYEEAVGTVTENSGAEGVWEGTFVFTEDTEINPEKTYYTQYAFDMWVYDCDTAAGIDNNGELVFPYGKEDTDYRVDGDPSSGAVFNGAGSIFWARIRKSCNDNVVAAFTGVPAECFNATHLITEFDKFQNCFPESIWRLDVERKYIRPFTGDDGATEDSPNQPIFLTRQNTRFLGDMMQGRKKYQRRQWVKDQGVYFGSKYMLQNIEGNQLDMTCYNPGNQNVLPNWDLTITPYQDMYLNADYGETTIRGRRAKKNVPVEIKCPFNTMNESRVRVYGADYIRALAGKPIKNGEGKIVGSESLASFYFRGNDFSHTNKLRELYIGSDDPTYTNSQFTKLNISANNPILEVLDLQNCDGLAGSLDLHGSTALQRLEIQGTQFSSVVLPGSTGIEVLHLPETITSITLNAAKKLQELTIKTRQNIDNTSNLTTLQINDSDYSDDIDWLAIADSILSHVVDLQLLNLVKAHINDITDLQGIVDKREQLGTTLDAEGNIIYKVNLSGLINVLEKWSEPERDYYIESFNNQVEFNTENGQKIDKHAVIYKNYDGTILWRDYKETGEYFVDPVYDIDPETGLPYIDIPTRESTVEYDYFFGQFTNYGDDPDRPDPYYIRCTGWRNKATNQMLDDEDKVGKDDVEFIAVYPRTEQRTYIVRWYDQDKKTIIGSTSVRYGNVIPNNAWPTSFEKARRLITNSGLKYIVFNGWDSPSVKVVGDTNIYSLWEESPQITQFTDDIRFDNLTAANLYAIASIENGALRDTLLDDYLGDETFDITMGYDPTYNVNGLTETNLLTAAGSSQELYLTGNRTNAKVISDLKPLMNLDQSWTMAFDFKFLLDNSVWYGSTTPEFVLVSCFNETGSTMAGFRVSLFRDNQNSTSSGNNVAVKIIWGKESTTTPALTIDKATITAAKIGTDPDPANVFNTYRNMLVLRHDGTYPNRLYVYTQSNMTDPQYYNTQNETVTETILTYDSSLQVTNPVILGGNYQLDTTTIEQNQSTRRPAKAMIYYAKYWNMDLGVRECRMLAAWPHETVKFRIQGYAEGQDLDSSAKLLFGSEVYPAKINIAAASPLGDRAYQATATTNDSTWKQENELRTGWQYTMIRNYCSTIVLNAFPITYQSLIATVMMKSSEMVDSSTNRATSQISADTGVNLFERIYLPSYQELYYSSTQTIDNRYSTEATHSWPLMTPRNVRLLFNMESDELVLVSNNTDVRPMRWAFPGRVMDERTRILMMSDNPISAPQLTPQDSTYADRDGVIILRAGDVWWNTNDNTPYMYATSIEITRGAPVEPSLTVYDSNTGTAKGGWIPAIRYGTRTYYMLAESTYNHNRRYSRNFLMVNNDGSVLDQTNAGTVPMTTRMIMPQFSI